MFYNIPIVLILIFFLGLQSNIGIQGVSLTLTPDRCIATTVDQVEISCQLSASDDGEQARDITLVEISRNNQKPMAFLKHCSNVSYGSDARSKVKAKGHIGKTPSETYLNLSLTNPQSEDTGIYTCTIYYTDSDGILQNEQTSQNLQVEKLDVQTLEQVLNSLKDKITDLEQTRTELGGNPIAFSAIDNRSKIIYTSNQVLRFPDVLMSVGGGYDGSTSIFTAPVDGLYSFYLTLATNAAGVWNEVEIKTDDKVLTKVGVGDKNYYAQSSASVVAQLEAGDRVFVWTASGKEFKGQNRSVFSGCLIMAS